MLSQTDSQNSQHKCLKPRSSATKLREYYRQLPAKDLLVGSHARMLLHTNRFMVANNASVESPLVM
jgi:hypothetical protein